MPSVSNRNLTLTWAQISIIMRAGFTDVLSREEYGHQNDGFDNEQTGNFETSNFHILDSIGEETGSYRTPSILVVQVRRRIIIGLTTLFELSLSTIGK